MAMNCRTLNGARAARLRRRLQLDIEGPRDPLQIVGECRELRSARIAPAPGETNRARIGGGRQGRVHNRIPRSDGEGRDEGTALTSSDHVFQSFQARAVAIAGAGGGAGGQCLLPEAMSLLQQQPLIGIELVPCWSTFLTGGGGPRGGPPGTARK